MGSDSRVGVNEKAAGFGADSIEQAMRERIRETIEQLVEEELEAALGAANSQRVGAQRTGYRHGKRERTLTTSLGPATFAMPRARVSDRDERGREWRSVVVPRYERRTERIDEAILGIYLSGTGGEGSRRFRPQVEASIEGRGDESRRSG